MVVQVLQWWVAKSTYVGSQVFLKCMQTHIILSSNWASLVIKLIIPNCLTPMLFSQYIWVWEGKTRFICWAPKTCLTFPSRLSWGHKLVSATHNEYKLILQSYISSHSILRLSWSSRLDRSNFSSVTHLEPSMYSLLKLLSISYTYMYFPHVTVSSSGGRSIIFLLCVPWLLS